MYHRWYSLDWLLSSSSFAGVALVANTMFLWVILSINYMNTIMVCCCVIKFAAFALVYTCALIGPPTTDVMHGKLILHKHDMWLPMHNNNLHCRLADPSL